MFERCWWITKITLLCVIGTGLVACWLSVPFGIDPQIPAVIFFTELCAYFLVTVATLAVDLFAAVLVIPAALIIAPRRHQMLMELAIGVALMVTLVGDRFFGRSDPPPNSPVSINVEGGDVPITFLASKPAS